MTILSIIFLAAVVIVGVVMAASGASSDSFVALVRHGFSRDSADLSRRRAASDRPARCPPAVATAERSQPSVLHVPAGRWEKRSTFLLTIKKTSMNFG